MTNHHKVAGDRFERAVTHWLRSHGFAHAERTRAGHARDWGDIHLTPDRAAILQCKAVREWRAAEWMRDLAEQIKNAGATHGAVIVKRRGTTNPGDAYVLTTLTAFTALLQAAAPDPAPLTHTPANPRRTTP